VKSLGQGGDDDGSRPAVDLAGDPAVVTGRPPGVLPRLPAGTAHFRNNASLAVELLAANAFIHSPEVAYLVAATRVLAVHPPGRPRAAKRINDYLSGSVLVLD
jgi:hypothetical protein